MEELNIKDLFRYLLKKLPIIILVTAIIFTSLEAYALYFKVPLYKGDTTLILVKKSNSNNSTVTSNDISLNQKLVTTYSEIVKSRRVLNQVKERLNLEYSISELSDKITVSSVSGTEMIKISVSDVSGYAASYIANMTAEIFSSEISEIYKIENVTVSIIDEAIIEDSPYNIKVVKDSIIYFTIGIVISTLIVLSVFLFDTTIKSVVDIENRLELPVLGTVPKAKKKRGRK